MNADEFTPKMADVALTDEDHRKLAETQDPRPEIIRITKGKAAEIWGSWIGALHARLAELNQWIESLESQLVPEQEKLKHMSEKLPKSQVRKDEEDDGGNRPLSWNQLLEVILCFVFFVACFVSEVEAITRYITRPYYSPFWGDYTTARLMVWTVV